MAAYRHRSQAASPHATTPRSCTAHARPPAAAEMTKPEEVKGMLDAAAYKKHCEESHH